MGSPSSFIRSARFRALYRKQYLTPTMIHKFVKTTPKPSATKNRSGDELLPDGGLAGGGPPGEPVADGDVDVVELLFVGVVPVGAGVDPRSVADIVCLTTMRTPSARA